jgi:hypothetical protein
MATRSKEFLLEFIEEFRGYPCICKVKSKEYHNREIKESAYSALTENVKTILIVGECILLLYVINKI